VFLRGEGGEGALRTLFAANASLLERIHLYQDDLDDTFTLTRLLQAPVQAILYHLGVGNEKVFVGRDGWLFYEPGIRYLTGPGFLSSRQLKRRAREGNELSSAPQPDPVKAIVHFRDQLRRCGIELIIMPTPTKVSIHPEHFSRRVGTRNLLLLNTSYVRLLDRLQKQNVHVFECLPLMTDAKFMPGPRFLKSDSHWVPLAVNRVAQSLAELVRYLGVVDEGDLERTSYIRHPMRVTNTGDLALMLDPDRTFLRPESVELLSVSEPGGGPWKHRTDADILLLGDSFANIYSLADMGWGEGAGLAEQLSYALQRPVDRIVRNDAGAYATREMLAKNLARGRDRLAGKKLVIWQFAARELSFGDWKLIDLPEVGDAPKALPASAHRVTGKVVQLSERPRKDASYKDFVMKVYLTGLKSIDGKAVGEGDGVVQVLAMRNRKFLPAYKLRIGSRVSLSIRPWGEVEDRYGSLKMGSLDDIMLEIEKPLYWGELE
jgi:alginate O-acetyltransferase complex protein AlgJ